MMTAEEILALAREGNFSLADCSAEQLTEMLPTLLAAIETAGENVSKCDERIKDFQSSKKYWQEAAESIGNAVKDVLIQNSRKSVVATDGTSATVSTRNILEADDQAILAPWRGAIEALKLSLPDYIQIKESVNKTALAKATKDDPMLIADNPEAIHYRESTSVCIKAAKQKEGEKEQKQGKAA